MPFIYIRKSLAVKMLHENPYINFQFECSPSFHRPFPLLLPDIYLAEDSQKAFSTEKGYKTMENKKINVAQQFYQNIG